MTQHSLSVQNNILTVNGVEKVAEIWDRQAQLILAQNTLYGKGTGLNVVKLDREQEVGHMETKSLQSLTYRQTSFGVEVFVL